MVEAYRFALDLTPAQAEVLRSHAGARNFTFNMMLAAVKASLDQRAAEKTYGLHDDDLTPAGRCAHYATSGTGSSMP